MISSLSFSVIPAKVPRQARDPEVLEGLVERAGIQRYKELRRQEYVKSQRYKKGREKETCEIPQRKKRREEAEKGREGLSPCRTGIIERFV
jgi:hypothetical protein